MLVEVALPLPIPRTFAYRVEAQVQEGTRVLVPFQNRRLIGWVSGSGGPGAAPDGVRPVESVLETEPSVPADLMRLARWIASYYIAPLGLVLRAVLPAALSRHGRASPPVRTRRVLRLTRDLVSLAEREQVFGRAPRQRECYELIESLGGEAETAHLTTRCGFPASVVDGLVRRGVAAYQVEEVARDPFAEMAVAPELRPPLTPAQQTAVDALVAAARAAGGSPFLLHGVTGSGKTLVYLELLDEVVRRQGRGAIVLVPEIALTPQTVARFRARFGDDVAVLHSGLSDGERYDAWRALRRGERRIAVGARSAVFAPLPDVGAIVVDEEHETTYKESEAPRYHAREVAIMRASMSAAVCLLGSATPSLESWANGRKGKFRVLQLPERVERRALPPVRVVDLRARGGTSAAGGSGPSASSSGLRNGVVGGSGAPAAVQTSRAGGSLRWTTPAILSAELAEAMSDRLARREQTILLLNRRGFASFAQCRSCGVVWRCEHCSVSLTYHRARARLVCHYCFHEEAPPARCDACGDEVIAYRGIGTEQLERAVIDLLPAARVARMDVDTTSGKWSHHRILDRFGRGEVDVLVGTQMIAKGLDFPNVTLVGIINADVALNLPDFRAGERTFQLLTQVAGRTGRGPGGGEVVLQTALPGHYVIRSAVTHDYIGFVERELAERLRPRYPPHCRIANVVVSGTDEEAVAQTAFNLGAWLRDAVGERDGVDLLGPAPCPVERIRDRWRWHIVLRATAAAALGRLLTRLEERGLPPGGAGARLAIDRDPVALL